MCGILGLTTPRDVAPLLVLGLGALQHRGQDAAGVAIAGRRHATRLHRGLGLVDEVFAGDAVGGLDGRAGIGHVRYATQGRQGLAEAQPFFLEDAGLALAHNGNVVNFAALRARFTAAGDRLLTSSDAELLARVLAAGGLDGPDDAFAAAAALAETVVGAYAAVALLPGGALLGLTDPHGVRPLVLGEAPGPGGAYALASETSCLDCIGFRPLRDLGPGEAVYIDAERRVHERTTLARQPAACVFETIYFAREDSVRGGRLVATERVHLGRRLAAAVRRAGLRPDVVIDVPASAYFCASGLAEELGVPYRRGLALTPSAGRSFIAPTAALRELIVRQKLNPIADVVRGRHVAVVDDSIVRGTTARHIVRLLRDAGAREVTFVSAAPPVLHPCVYGIDMSIPAELLARSPAPATAAERVGADAVIYGTLDDLREVLAGRGACCACFDGRYPVAGTTELLADVERDRHAASAAAQ